MLLAQMVVGLKTMIGRKPVSVCATSLKKAALPTTTSL